MIPLRLRSSRSIRPQFICSSCCTHVAQSAGVRRPAAVTARTYATKKKKKAAEAATKKADSSEDKPETKKSEPKAKPETSGEAKSSQPAPDAAEASSSKPAKSTGRTKKAAQSPRKEKPSTKAAANAGPTVIPTPKGDETMELWKETLDILKSLQVSPPATEAPSGADTAKGNDGQKGDSKEKRSLKSQFAPMQGAPSKATQRQAKLLEGTLDVLKNVLTIQADQRAKSGKPKNADEGPDSQKEPAKRRSRETREEQPSSTSSKKGRSAPSSSKSKVGNVGWDTKKGRNIQHINTSKLALEPVDAPTAPVPRISYDLDRVLFNEGVYVLQDPRSKVYNFDPYLSTIMPVDEFDFDALKQYVTSSKDELLIGIAKKHKKMFTGSTSSMTSTLAHFHYLLSSWRPINPEKMSKGFVPDSENFGAILRAPAATFLHYKDGTYAIDADKEYDAETILSMLGKSMEKLLTVPKDEFEKYRRRNSHQLTEEERNAEESYHYTTFRDFMMRSQLDAYDPRLPGSGVYDLKTRAVVSIRMDATNHHKGQGYEIRQQKGQWESFEREYYDMIRLAFLKYSLQVRMGRMDGIFVAYHNTQRIFGFQYVPLEEMDLSIHGTTDLTIGSREFMASLQLWEEMLKKASEMFPEQSLRVHVETRPSASVPFMYFFAEPVTEDEIKAIQEGKKEEIAKFHEQVLGIKPKPEAEADGESLVEESDALEEDVAAKEEDAEEDSNSADAAEAVAEEDSEDVWEDMMEAVEETMENDAQGITAIREAIEEALEESGLLHAASTEEAQRYVEALLKSIVDVDAEQAKTGSEGEDETVAESGVSAGTEDNQNQASKSSPFGFLSSWFGGKSNEAKTTPKEESVAETEDKESKSQQEQPSASSNNEQDQTLGDSLKQASAKVADAVVEGAEKSTKAVKEAVDGKSDDSLKDLIVKLTSRVGLSSDASKTTDELSEDQAKLRRFESILLEMIPKAEESSSEPAEDNADPDADEVSEAPAEEGKEKRKPVLGLILTIRNNVNNTHVQRPENLSQSDKWNVEYTIEDIPEDKAQNLYESMKKRRHRAYYKEPGKDFWAFAFNGMLKHYTREGRQFRDKETKAARGKPTYMVGQDEPLTAEQYAGPAHAPFDPHEKAGPRLRGGVPVESIRAQLDRMKADNVVYEAKIQEQAALAAKAQREFEFPENSIAKMREKLMKENGPATFKQWREENTKEKAAEEVEKES
ncbi:hypothetical protein VMCG_04514 [Cytospora schulzeri]|uniref:Uncharacterized protein n=1 Tax=Cytospora schulzeri TaxID=448051 RepID=A0A423WRT6_9PEZI|nr:hypothetical protein VMCG_04514 [Valsa malicola]